MVHIWKSSLLYATNAVATLCTIATVICPTRPTSMRHANRTSAHFERHGHHELRICSMNAWSTAHDIRIYGNKASV